MNGIDISRNLPPQLIVFDGVCNLCNGLVQFIITRDPQARFSFTALQSPTGQQLLGQYQLPATDFDSFIYIKSGKLYQRSTAALHVLRDLGGIWSVLYIFIIIPRFIRDAVYDLVARSRYRIWGQRDSCMVPTADVKRRFV